MGELGSRWTWLVRSFRHTLERLQYAMKSMTVTLRVTPVIRHRMVRRVPTALMEIITLCRISLGDVLRLYLVNLRCIPLMMQPESWLRASGTIMIVPVILRPPFPMTVACSTMVSVLLWNRLRVPQTVQPDHRPLDQLPIPMAMMMTMMMMTMMMMTMMMIRTSGGVVVVHVMMIRKSGELKMKKGKDNYATPYWMNHIPFPC